MSTQATNRQVPSESILSYFNREAYLGNSFLLSSGVISGQTSETPLLYLSNPSSNYNQNSQAGNLGCFQGVKRLSVSAGVSATFNFYLNPSSVSAGTAQTPVNLRPSSSYLSKMVGNIGPTVGGNGTYLFSILTQKEVIDSSSIYILDPGYSLLVTALVASTAKVVCDLIWYEI